MSSYKNSTLLGILDTALDGFVHIDRNGFVLGWNPQAEKIFGWSKSEAIGKKIYGLIIPAALKQDLVRDMSHDITTGDSKILNQRVKVTALHRDGRHILIEIAITAIVSEEEVEYGAFIRDITDASIAENKLRESEEKYRSLVEDAADVILTIDRDFRINFINHLLPGFTREKVIGASSLDFIPIAERERISGIYKEIFSKKKPQKYQIEGIMADGSKMWFSTLANPIFSGNNVIGITLLTRDITDIKRAEDALKKQHEQLVISAKLSSLGEMAAGVAHEINNPLSIIYGLSSQTKRKHDAGTLDPEILGRNLATILTTTERIAKIVKGLRTFSRDATDDPMEIAAVLQIIDDTLELCREKFHIHSIDLRVDCDPSLLILCRPSQMSQVLMNLLGNAHDAIENDPEKWVEIRAVKNKSLLELSVKDSGKGIRRDIAAKMMQPFFTTKETGKGTGLGLSISRGIVEAHNGRLYYDENCPNTRFVVEMQLTDPSSTHSAK